MKTSARLMALGFAFIAPQLCIAQVPAGAPAGTTALCTDGTYSQATSKVTACIGHKGVKTWYGTTKSSATSAGKTTTTGTSTTKPSATTPATSSAHPTTPAPATSNALSKPVTPTTPATPPPTTKMTATTPSPTTAGKPTTGGSSAAPAPGGGPNLVWENTGGSKVYHCPGTTYYGKTKAGKYVTEAQAKADGYHPNGGNACFK